MSGSCKPYSRSSRSTTYTVASTPNRRRSRVRRANVQGAPAGTDRSGQVSWLGAPLVKIRTLLLGPIFADPTLALKPRSHNPSNVEAALRTVDRALDTLCSTLGISAAAA